MLDLPPHRESFFSRRPDEDRRRRLASERVKAVAHVLVTIDPHLVPKEQSTIAKRGRKRPKSTATLARSGFVLRSPRPVSRKREFSWIRLETFGNVRPKKFEHRSPETFGDEKSPHLAGLSQLKKDIL